MLKVFTTHEVEVMRREAKKRSRAEDVILAEALDKIAVEHGYRNWSLLHRNSTDLPQPWSFRRTPGEIALSMRVVPEPRSRSERRRPWEIARDSVQPLDGRFISAANAADFAIAYVEGLLGQPRFQLNPTRSVAYWEMRLWLPYAVKQLEGDRHILVNRNYKPVGSTSREYVYYALYPHLSLRLPVNSWRAFSHRTAQNPFLYIDGRTPWDSRQDAEAYLGCLKELRRIL
ncbi:hypothetical protein [Xanthomonas albilineans]|uniref:hypothetical protein n=1 Tax=Xanthomonas albilineans TaxID=29447 RepID=UPI0005F34F48|nr:hypothetical protein [Xanthomonas albilineans]